MVTAINHAQLRLGRDFKQEEFDSGAVGQLMIDEDFNFEKAVSLFLYELEFVLSLGLISDELKSAFKFVNVVLYIFFTEGSPLNRPSKTIPKRTRHPLRRP